MNISIHVADDFQRRFTYSLIFFKKTFRFCAIDTFIVNNQIMQKNIMNEV